jgi:hypothetical protein
LSVLGAAAALWLGVACLDVSSPVSGITSISFLMPATPSVVRHDSLRDTLGAAQPLRVYAFAANGDTVRDVVVRFFAIDTTHQLHVDSITGYVWGDTMVSPNAAIFARVRPANGKGFLDTPLDTIPVVPPPKTAVSDTNFLFTFDPTVHDTNSSVFISAPFGVTLKGDADTTIQKYIVGFQLVRSPTPRTSPTDSTVVLTSPLSTAESTYAVTDASGRATLRLRLRLAAVPTALLLGGVDTAVVRFRIRYFDPTLRQSVLIPVAPDSIIITIQSK